MPGSGVELPSIKSMDLRAKDSSERRGPLRSLGGCLGYPESLELKTAVSMSSKERCQCASAFSSVVFSGINIVCTRIATAQRRRLPSSQVSRGIWYRRCALISWRNLELYWPATHTSVGALL